MSSRKHPLRSKLSYLPFHLPVDSRCLDHPGHSLRYRSSLQQVKKIGLLQNPLHLSVRVLAVQSELVISTISITAHRASV
jgi:hypothetical protein